MLQFILGIAGSGKTTHMLNSIKSRAKEGKNSIFLVPEQFSSSAEMLMFQHLGDEHNGYVEVLSFRTLAQRIFKSAGGMGTPVLSDAGRVVFIRRALDSLQEYLPLFSRYRHNTSFCQSCSETIAELKTAGVSPVLLEKLHHQQQEPKFGELALIFSAYNDLLEGSAIDPEDRLVLAAQKADCGFFDDKACFIDNFDGFTAPEYKMLEQLILHCPELHISLCCDGLQETDGGLGLFSPVRKTASSLLRIAANNHCPAAPVVQLGEPKRPLTPGLMAVNLLLAEGECDETSPQGIFLTNPADEWEETRIVAAKVRQLAQDGVNANQIAVVCRDIAQYETPMRHAFSLYDIPFFLDSPGSIEYSAPVVFLRAALSLLRDGIASTPILTLLKTGLCGYTESEISALENYVYTWEPKSAEWRQPFEKNPGGFLASMEPEKEKQLEMAERLRFELLPVVDDFLQNGKGRTAQSLSKQLYLLMDRVGAPEQVELAAQQFEQQGEFVLADTTRRAYDLTMDILDQMAQLLQQEKVSATEYDDLLLLLVRSTDFSSAPQAIESVLFTSADRMRLANPDYCFVLGASEGEFPRQVGYSGLFTHADRDLLVAEGVNMPGSFENRILLEEMFFYHALTASQKALFVSWPKRHGGSAKSMSSALEPILVELAPQSLALETEQLCATPAAAFEQLGLLYRDNTPKAASLYEALHQNRGKKNTLDMLNLVQNAGKFTLKNPAILQTLLGSSITLSATRAEKFYECRFAYFLERVLGVYPRRKAEFSPLESGTLVHYVLEQVVRQAGQAFPEYTDAQLMQAAHLHADAFIAQNLPQTTKRSETITTRVKNSIYGLLVHLRDFAAQSGFVIDALELPIADTAGAVPPIEMLTPEGRKVRVTGKIDRVDVLRKDGKTYLCIVDYKTGGRKFSLEDVYCGLNMQMMIYMLALCKNAADKYPNPIPAGVLYVTGDPRPATGERQSTNVPLYEMDGLLLDDPEILKALDKQGNGIFLPFKHKDGAALRAGKKLATLEKMGRIESHVQTLLAEMAREVYQGDFSAVPLVKAGQSPCQWCAYRAVCRHEDGRSEKTISAPADAFQSDNKGGEPDA